MEQQKKRAREAHKSIDIIVSEDEHSVDSTEFCGFKHSNLHNFTATCTDLVSSNDQNFLVVDQSPLYAEMGGQVGDSGIIKFESKRASK